MVAKQKHGVKIIWGIFALFTVLFIFNVLIKTSISPTSMMWLVLALCVTILSQLFGLPFAILQRKRDLTSAMIAHGVVDVIRFCFLGAPF